MERTQAFKCALEMTATSADHRSSSSPLLEAFFAGVLCRDPKLSPTGRTRSAVVIGLGDEDVDGASVLIYGQRVAETSTLKLCVGRKRPPPPPTEAKVRPGEPLPRGELRISRMELTTAPLLFPDVTLKRGAPRRTLSRASSVSAMYQPPAGIGRAPSLPPPVASGSRTPGRMGDKRPRREDNERKRRSGLIVPEDRDEEDIFGGGPSRASSVRPHSTREPSLRAPSVARSMASTRADDDEPARKRSKLPESKQSLDNKGVSCNLVIRS